MVFTEEVPPNFKPSCPCKRRSCPLQDFFLDHAHGAKRFFKYQCSDPKIWAVCLRWLPLSDKSDEAKAQTPPIAETKPPAIAASASEPAKQAANPLKCPVAGCKFTAITPFQLNKHLDSIHHQAPPQPTEPAPEPPMEPEQQ